VLSIILGITDRTVNKTHKRPCAHVTFCLFVGETGNKNYLKYVVGNIRKFALIHNDWDVIQKVKEQQRAIGMKRRQLDRPVRVKT
jgi:hypothetical protein